MKFSEIRAVVAIAAMAILSACGGGAGTDPAYGPTTTNAALMVQGGNAPVADCEAEGCNRPRIIDGLAEQYRAGAIEQQALPAEPAAPVEAAALQPAAMPAPALPTEAAPAAPAQLQ